MHLKTTIAAAFAVAFSCVQAFGQATILPPGETCFQATTGINGMVGVLGTITAGSGGTAGTYGGVALTGGSGTGATANITVSGGGVTTVSILNPGVNYVVGDILSAASGNIGSTVGFSVPVNSISINSAVAGGTVAFYIPNTLTPKQTWQNAGETVLNTNPVQLDANGCAIIYGAGIYRQILKDSLSNTIWDQLTASVNNAPGIFWAALAGGTGNAITVVDTAFANQDGYNIQFLAKAANTGPATISVSGGTPIAIVNDTSSGPAALTGGEIGPNNTPMLTYDATNVEFHIVNPSATSGSTTTSGLTPPQGYLNLVGQATGDVVQTADVIGATTVFYSPFVGDTIPIWNGSLFKQIVFSELTATLTAAGSPSNTIQDACVFSNNGVPTLVFTPSWTTVTAGAGNRGTGAGTPQLTRLQGIWTNAVQIIGYNGLSSFTIPTNQCTYVGSLYIDNTAGQVTAHRTYGVNRKFGVWNAYNRQAIILKSGDASATWTYATNTFRASHNNPAAYSSTVCNVGSGTTCDGLVVFQGLPEEIYDIQFAQTAVSGAANANAQNGIGYNSITATSGVTGAVVLATNSAAFIGNMFAAFQPPPSIGINNVFPMENAPNSGVMTFNGQETGAILSARWHG